MPSDPGFRAVAANFVTVQSHYDGLNGSIIKWGLERGNDNHDPSVLAWVLAPDGEVIEMAPGGVVYQAGGFAKWLATHATASFPLIDPAQFPVCRKEATAVAARRKLGATLQTLRGWADDAAEPARQAEATQLRDKLLAYARWKQDRATQKRDTDPVGTLALQTELSKEFSGDPIGDDATAQVAALKKDDAFQDNLKATQILDKALAVAGSKTKKGKPDPVVLRQAGGLLAALRKKYPETPAAARATTLLKAWGLDP